MRFIKLGGLFLHVQMVATSQSKLVNLKPFFISREKLSDNMKAGSFPKDKVFFCDPGKLLPLARFLPQPKKPAGKVAKPAGRGYVFF